VRKVKVIEKLVEQAKVNGLAEYHRNGVMVYAVLYLSEKDNPSIKFPEYTLYSLEVPVLKVTMEPATGRWRKVEVLEPINHPDIDGPAIGSMLEALGIPARPRKSKDFPGRLTLREVGW
jgi:hypothetical protein